MHSTLDSQGRRSPAKRSPAKRSPKKRIPVQSAYSVQKEKRDKLTMVTTRRQSGALLLGSQSNSAATSENEINEDEIAYELLTLSAQKRRREKAREAGEETPTKRRKVPIREKGISPAVTVHSRLAVEIPLKDVDEEGEATPQAISDVAAKLADAETSATSTPTNPRKRARPSKKSLLDAEEQLKKDMAAFEAEKAQKSTSNEAAPATEAPKPKKTKTSPPAPAGKVTAPLVEEEKKEAPAKPKHKKFGDDEPVEAIPLPEPIVPEEEGSESEEESSDDDAPEEVGGKAAEKQAQEKVAQAAKVAEQKEAAERLKRKERDEKLRKQSEAAKKRKAVEEEKSKMMPVDELESESEEDESMTLQEESSPVLETAKKMAREKKIKFDRNNLPDLLPEEFLDDEDAMDVDEEEQKTVKKAKKISFAREEKKVKDVTLGHTTFRVQKKSKAGLAPKANKRAKMLKEALLGGRKGQIRKAATGFFGAKK